MHDRGNGFTLDAASPNVLAPGKRPMHTLSPVLAQRRDAAERLVVGTMGGRMQGQILTQVVSHLLDGASAADAVGAPRMTFGAWEDDDPPDGVNVESDVGDDFFAELDRYSGSVKRLPAQSSEVGNTHAIRVRGSTMDVAADPRSDG
jgi:gamma-glutamyltranspeptidase/glutathione hydrolase